MSSNLRTCASKDASCVSSSSVAAGASVSNTARRHPFHVHPSAPSSRNVPDRIFVHAFARKREEEAARPFPSIAPRLGAFHHLQFRSEAASRPRRPGRSRSPLPSTCPSRAVRTATTPSSRGPRDVDGPRRHAMRSETRAKAPNAEPTPRPSRDGGQLDSIGNGPPSSPFEKGRISNGSPSVYPGKYRPRIGSVSSLWLGRKGKSCLRIGCESSLLWNERQVDGVDSRALWP